MNNSKLLSIAAFCILCGVTVLVANAYSTDELDIIYGKGVHAFFDRNYEEAIAILLEAEKRESADPRPYYFLGLAYLRQKKTERADHFFEKAAQLEYSGRAARDYAIAESLRRIQGEERLRIENIRTEERVNAQMREQRLQEIRYGKEKVDGREILRQSSPQNRKEDLAILQKITESFGDNAFGTKPIDPTNSSEEIVAVKRTGNTPFGEITANVDALPGVVEVRSPAGRANALAKRQEKTETQDTAGVSPLRSGQAAAAREFGKSLRAMFANATEEVVPTVTAMEPANGATDVDAESVSTLRITFDVDMNTKSFPWRGREMFPRTTGQLTWIDDKTCELPVSLEPANEYNLWINTPNDRRFQSKEGVPVQPLLYKFSTQ